MNPQVDLYLKDGCGRCKYYATPKCKVHQWPEELKAMRVLVLESGLTEELKWSMPVYTYNNKNVIIVAAFKEYCSLSFTKGVLLKDKKGILQKQGENGQSVKIFKCTGLNQFISNRALLKTYIAEAIEIEKAGLKVAIKKNSEPLPAVFQTMLDENPALHKAFYNLTPGRQRAYLIYFSQPKQTKTIISRIEKSVDNIMKGIGWQER
jgi:uncharacterized protein YdeI (YjbR/CyaY-like superfamily)